MPLVCGSVGMAQDVRVIVGAEDRARMAAIVGDRSRPPKHVQRTRIVPFSAERLAVLEVAHRAGGMGWSVSTVRDTRR